jgi:LysM repeat protein
MTARNGGRYIAPIALVVTIAALYVIVHSGLSKAPADSPSGQHSIALTRTTTKAKQPAGRRGQSYVVQPGDTLSGIALKTGVSVQALETLNPSVNPNALRSGQRLRLRRG